MDFWQHRWNGSSQFDTACQNQRDKRDFVVVSNVSDKPISGKQTGLVPTLKWIFGIPCALEDVREIDKPKF